MKRILLASTAIVVLAGAAAAEVTFTGTAKLGYNTDEGSRLANDGVSSNNFFNDDDDEGFYSDLDITAGLSMELDNGLTAAASINLDDFVSSKGSDEGTADYVLSLTNDMAGLYYGDTQFAAERMWISAGDMESDSFSEADGEEVLRGEVSYGNIEAQLSYVLANNAGTRNANDDMNQLSVGASADFGNFNVIVAYQERSGEAGGFYSNAEDAGPDGIFGNDPSTAVDESFDDSTNAGYGDNGDFNDSEILGISVGTTFAGATVRVAYAEDDNSDSLGVKFSYPFGPVTGTAYYVSESVGEDNWGLNVGYADGPIAVALDYQNDQGVDKYGLEGSYDVGSGLKVYAGYLVQDNRDDRYYVAGTYDLGSGAELLISYAEDDNNVDEDEIGKNDYQRGTTVEVSFQF